MTRAVLLLFVMSTAACSVLVPPMPKTGTGANGQPLSLRESMITEREQYKEHVATVRDNDGHTIANIYEEGTRINHIPVWFGYQGGEYVDAEDFFKIAGDPENQARVRRSRKLAYLANRGGWIATAAGIGLILLTSELPESTPGRTGIFLGGLLGFGLGAPAAIWGAQHLSPERHGIDSMAAALAADQYNQHLGASVNARAVKVGWQF